MRTFLLFAVALATVSCAHDAGGPTEAVIPHAGIASISDRTTYIVVFRDDVADPRGRALGLAKQYDGEVAYTYTAALKGFAGVFPTAAIAGLARNPVVAFVEPDREMTAFTEQMNPPSWGLDRIDQRSLSLDSKFMYTKTGSGVNAYIIDTGIQYSHKDFGNRAIFGFDAFKGGKGDDCNGHGTHVAGTVGGTTYGVAKGATLVAVRVLNCSGSGTTSGVIAGVDWVTASAKIPAVANMSLGGSVSPALDKAVQNSIASGIAYSIAAGNSNADACSYSPARVPDAMTIGATDQNDARASFSNFGACVDWFAPGVGIISDYKGGSTATMSGTSMAAPHTAGVAALYLQLYPNASAAAVRNALYEAATQGVVKDVSTTSPRLLFTSY